MRPEEQQKTGPLMFSTPMVPRILDGTKTETRRLSNRGWKLGDHAWVRETWGARDLRGFWAARVPDVDEERDKLFYLADGEPAGGPALEDPKWLPALFMPRWASRITLEIVAVRSERLLEITDAGALAEGVLDPRVMKDVERFTKDPVGNADGFWSDVLSPRSFYLDAWDKLNGKKAKAKAEENPLVSVLEFRRVRP